MLEIIRDPLEEAHQFCLGMNEDHEVFRDPGWEWFKWCERVSRNDRLMVYRHRVTGRFVLGVWAWSPDEASRPCIQELEGFTGEPGRLWPQDLLHPFVMEKRLQPVHNEVERMQKKIAAKEAAKRKLRMDQAEEKKAAVEILRKQGLEEEARALASGAVPFSGKSANPEGHAFMVEELTRLQRNT